MEAHLDLCEACRRAVAAAASELTLPVALTAQTLEPGMRVGRYEIQQELGRGGMGVVYLARDVTLDRRIALKLLHARHDQAAQARLLREAQVMARLAHPNVVPVFELGEWRGELYLTMELVDGLTLDRWLATVPRTPTEVLEKFLEAARGLAAAHAAGVVHRDFKPANVLVGVDGRVRVTDFGLSRPGPAVSLPPLASPLVTRDGALVGTLAYMAPEQLDGATADERSDQFSFCVALAEALLGERPFEGRTWSELARAHAIVPTLRGRLSLRVRQVLKRGLARDPAQRFPSLTALMQQLEAPPPRTRQLMWAVVGAAALVAAVPLARARLITPRVTIVAAANDLPPGTIISWDQLVTREAPAVDLPGSVVMGEAATMLPGLKLTEAVRRGEPLLWNEFEQARTGTRVLVAADELAEGTVLTRALLEERLIDPSLATASVVRPEQLETLLGQAVRTPSSKGDLLTWGQFEQRAGGRPMSSIVETLRSHVADLKLCIQSWSRVHHDAQRLTIVGLIDTTGTLSNVHLEETALQGTELEGCIRGVAQTLRFPPAGEPMELSFPITFSSQY